MAVWDPFRELERLRQEMELVFEGALGGARAGGSPRGQGARRSPRVNLAEDRENYLLEALAPGLDPETLEVSVEENVLTLAGEKVEPGGIRAEAFHRSERSSGRFLRRVELPGEVEPEKVRASYSDGILAVKLPKAERVKPRRIEISVASGGVE